MTRIVVVALLLLTACAGPGEIRETGFNRTVTIAGSVDGVADCAAAKMDDALAPLGNTLRKTETGRTILTRDPNRAVAVTDLTQRGSLVEARISIGPAVFPADNVASAIEKAVRSCGA